MYNISYKSLIHSKPLCTKFNKIDGFIRVDGTIYLELFGVEKYNSIHNRSTYLISVKSGITCIISYNHATLKVDSYDSFSLKNNDFLQCYSTH